MLLYYDTDRSQAPNGWVQCPPCHLLSLNRPGNRFGGSWRDKSLARDQVQSPAGASGCYEVTTPRLEPKDRRKFAHHFMITDADGTPYILAADTKTELRKWTAALGGGVQADCLSAANERDSLPSEELVDEYFEQMLGELELGMIASVSRPQNPCTHTLHAGAAEYPPDP